MDRILKIHNTMTKRKESFTSLKQGEVGMYVCGVTVYDLCHIGHARSAIAFDAVYRFLRYLGYKVKYVRNYTDIDDKIIKRAEEEKTDFEEIAERYIRAFDEDMETLGLLKPTVEPRATEHIKEMIEMIRILMEKGYAYDAADAVYFSVKKFKDYGKLSGQDMEQIEAGARIAPGEHKRDAVDFALWKKSKPGEPWWESPWGRGRPGWHIECSVMSNHYLGKTFDIHGGGKDLIFPHHENEIAQSEAANDAPFARFWIHNGWVTVNGEKMSKSLGNFVTIRDALKRHHPEVLRFFFLSSHYRSDIDYTERGMINARRGLERIYATLAEIDRRTAGVNAEIAPVSDTEKELDSTVEKMKDNFIEAMCQDFNTALALGYIHEVTRELNRFISGVEMTSSALSVLSRAGKTLRSLGASIGILQDDPEEFLTSLKELDRSKLSISEEEIERLVAERTEARNRKDWTTADAIRSRLAEMNIQLEDTPQGTVWKLKYNPTEGDDGR